MGKVIRIVRLPGWGENMGFALTLPKGTEVFKVGGAFAGLVDTEGNPIPTDVLYLLVAPGETETEVRRFHVGSLTSGLDDLTSDVPALPGTFNRYISDLREGYMLFELLDPPADATLADTGVPVIQI